ncbi:hypothetical protein K502DRAFT_351065 [Neoconidiobolus thromboides FSU 785]|nr:hypothetical protein K502DRAFT_351065 [Neoconidiobolus thromboides FSU 785]
MAQKKNKKKTPLKSKLILTSINENEELINSSEESTPIKLDELNSPIEMDNDTDIKKIGLNVLGIKRTGGLISDSHLKEEITRIEPESDNSESKSQGEWSVAADTLLFKCIANNKPAGLHKHFRMANICYLFNKNNAHPKTNLEIWERLNELYDMQAVDEIELKEPDEWSCKLGNHIDLSKQIEFELPPQFKELMNKKFKQK